MNSDFSFLLLTQIQRPRLFGSDLITHPSHLLTPRVAPYLRFLVPSFFSEKKMAAQGERAEQAPRYIGSF